MIPSTSAKLLLLAALVALDHGLLVAQTEAPPAAVPATVATPESLPGAETFIFRPAEPQPVRLHVFKPKEWQESDRRPAFIWFYGGGFVRGTPLQSAGWARRAASLGLVGIAPDYRTVERWPGSNATATVADARAAVRWVQAHAEDLGVDPARVIVGGSSAGGHLALWTAITATPPGLDPDEAPLHKPVALLLTSPAADTSTTSGLRAERFGAIDQNAFSPLQNLDTAMPPVLLIHGDADPTVPYAHAVALHRALTASGNRCDFITVPGGTHRFSSELPEWGRRVPVLYQTFLKDLALLPGNP
jgi:acetyl esterase